ncbi:hypothetical protein JTB14_025484 [Gonioctena quinquepunctata]|nr:hypothetical protein JTB14_025484 [Gonioctena quinquepunctata]
MTEEAKLNVIARNLHPFYQDHLREPLPKDLSELRTTCRRIDKGPHKLLCGTIFTEGQCLGKGSCLCGIGRNKCLGGGDHPAGTHLKSVKADSLLSLQ